uniref:Uncharacterized protein n=1 Tax=Ananas comosus var. bracteatus TaxID=296719 RepID=A0A6V7PYA2_ANACO|nr:unnamed protein product [Ananas comosus var. bracteatus]
MAEGTRLKLLNKNVHALEQRLQEIAVGNDQNKFIKEAGATYGSTVELIAAISIQGDFRIDYSGGKSGDNSRNWIRHYEKYFEIHGIREPQKLEIAAMYLEPRADTTLAQALEQARLQEQSIAAMMKRRKSYKAEKSSKIMLQVCGDKYSPGHQYKQQIINILNAAQEVTEVYDENSLREPVEREESENEEEEKSVCPSTPYVQKTHIRL